MRTNPFPARRTFVPVKDLIAKITLIRKHEMISSVLGKLAPMLLAVVAATLLAACSNTGEGLTRADVVEIARAEMANAPAPAPAVTRTEAEQIAQSAVAGISMPESGISRAEAEQIAQAAAANIEVPEPGLTRAEAEQIAQAAIDAAPAPEPGLTTAEVERIVQSAIDDLPEPEGGINSDEAHKIARSVVATIPPRSTPDAYTKYFVDNAITRYEAFGRDEALQYYNSVESVDGPWYVFIVDENDKVLAHYNPHLLGEDLNGPIGIDANGYNFAPALLSATEEGKWVSYVYRNPVKAGPLPDHLGAVELKLSWVVRHDGLLFGSGWYSSADEYTKMLVDRAIARFYSDGLEATLEHYNNPDSVVGQWYVFIADTGDDSIIAHYDQGFVSQDLNGLIGSPEFRSSQRGEWVSYRDVNPVTDEVQGKHFWVVERGGLVFGSGW